MGVQTLAVAALLVSALALAAGVVLLLRFGMLARRSEGPLEPALRHLDQGLRDELLRSRGIAAEDARSLREEVAGAVVRLGDSLQRTVEGRLEAMRADNAAKLESIRATVDEKLHKTLEERLGASFKLVSNQLEQVFKSVGEMQSLAAGVGDLKRVLTNVKARGTWGEISLGGVLEQALTAEQYERNVEIRPGSNQRVEFAVRLPGADGDGPLWLPIDAKFPTEDYERLGDAAERADGAGVEIAGKAIETRIRLAARDICAKIVRRPGLVDTLQRDWRVVVAGPTTLLALLNSLRMGFRSLAIQKRSSEVWHLLRAVKTEFGRYGEVLDKVQKKLSEASNTIENVAVRRRQIDRKLAQIETLPEPEALVLLGLDGPDAAPAED
jgi:DNA recombination protein RmuC